MLWPTIAGLVGAFSARPPPLCARCALPRSCLAPPLERQVKQLIDTHFGAVAPPSRYLPAEAEASVGVDLTYGELDFEFFTELLSAVEPKPGETFLDIGSGCGRLVAAAALLHPWSRAVGIEIVGELHEEATSIAQRLAATATATGLPLSPCEFVRELAQSAVPRLLGGAAASDEALSPCVVFCYATTWPCGEGYKLVELSSVLGSALPTGSRVVVVGRRLEPSDGFDEIGFSQRQSEATGLKASAFVYELNRNPASKRAESGLEGGLDLGSYLGAV